MCICSTQNSTYRPCTRIRNTDLSLGNRTLLLGAGSAHIHSELEMQQLVSNRFNISCSNSEFSPFSFIQMEEMYKIQNDRGEYREEK